MSSIAIIINSCQKFYETTIDKIIDSAKKANIPSSHIYIIVGECEEDIEMTFTGNYNIVFCKYVNEAYNSAIYFTQTKKGREEIQKYSHFFYTQDTTMFLEHFWDRIQSYVEVCSSYIKLEELYSKNIGFFNVEWFLENKTELMSYYVNYDKSRIMDYKAGDFPNKDLIYNKFNHLARWLNEDCLYLFGPNHEPLGYSFTNPTKDIFMVKIYSEEERRATVYENPGIIKYQKNWGQGGWNLNL